ncbi:hypothetical protein [Spirillospora sp. CA-294931]|uniref:hypothetical protein n=1 Tax=Spirillospora sp. CA-294931 TaxID=3240042 RepID=UPI003D8ED924
MYCSTCGDDRHFEQPPCLDGHGPDCPERVCAECGSAVLIGLPAGVPAFAVPRPAAADSFASGRSRSTRAVA